MTNPIIVVLKITPVELAGYTYHLQGCYLRLWGQEEEEEEEEYFIYPRLSHQAYL